MVKNIATALLIGVIALTAACTKVPAGNVGVKVYLLGGNKGVDSEELGVGRYYIGMNEELYLFPTFTQNVTWDGNDAIGFQTKEGMNVTAPIGMSYRVDPTKVTALYQKYRKGIDEITDVYLRNMVRDAMVSIVGTKSVENVYGAGKSEIITAAEQRVREQVAPFGIIIERLYWTGSANLPPQVVESLNNKIKSTQMAEQRENEIAQSTAEANKERERAKGVADAKLLEAEADAKAIKLRGDAIRENPQVATLNAIEKWDGKLPEFLSSGTPLPFNLPITTTK